MSNDTVHAPHIVGAPLACADHAWLRMDTPDNLVVIHLALAFAGELPLRVAQDMLRSQLLPHHPFTHRVDRSGWRARWMPDTNFTLARHLHELHLPEGSGRNDLQSLIARQASRPLPTNRPLWRATLVHGVAGASVLVMQVHHSLVDGVSLMPLLTRMTELSPGEAFVAPSRPSPRDELSAAVLARRAPRALADALHMIFMRRDKASRIKGQPGRNKSVAWSQALPLQSLRELAQQHGATVNDAMLAIIAGVLRRYLQAHGQAQIDAPLRAIIPMNMRPRGEEHQLGNRFGLVGQELPVQLDDPLQRLFAVRDGMSSLKRGLQGQLALALLSIAGSLPAWLQRPLLGMFTRRCSVIVTSVIGPGESRSVEGVRLDDLIIYVPQGMSIGVGISIVSYAGALRVGFLVDEQLMPHVAGAAASVLPCFEQLRRASQAMPAPALNPHSSGAATASPGLP